MKRKTIGVFVSGDDEQLHGEFILGVKKEAQKRNCNIVCMHSLKNKAIYNSGTVLAKSVIAGESSTFTSMDFSQFDAIIIMGDTFIDDSIKEQVICAALKAEIPVINVDDDDERCHCIRYDDSTGMEVVVRHVIEEHGCKRVNFISGFKGNRQSEDRIEAYRKVLAENGIPIEDERIGYGEFYIKSIEVMKNMLESNGLPEAVVCANDTMALMVIGYLTSLGYEIPKDCIVTGFDGTKDGQVYMPALTTVKRAIYQSGEKAVSVAIDLIEGEEVDHVIWLDPVLVKNQSCGCVDIEENPFDKIYSLFNNRVNDRNMFNANLIQMTRDFANCKDVWSIVDTAFNYAWFFKVPSLTFCINDEVYMPKANNLFGKAPIRDSVYSELLSERKWLASGEKSDVKRVSSRGFIRNHLITSEEPVFMGIIPMYYNERIIGFITLDQTYCVSEFSLLSTWLVNICSAIGNQCLMTEMELLINKLDSMYVKDSLTGFYNRFGLQRKAAELISNAKKGNRKVYAVGIDLDELKIINDTCGHEAGDNAILQVSNAMNVAADSEEILSRIGGDEYFVLGYCDSDDHPEKYIRNVHRYLTDYNARNRLDYRIDCSCGYYISDLVNDDIESIMRKADKMMYNVKEEKKAKKAAKHNGK